MTERNLWILKSKGAKSSFGGNDGYNDKPDAYYVYDNFVPNYSKIKEGDYALIANKYFLLGFGVIDDITINTGLTKQRYKCPDCGIKEHSERLTKVPRYKCRNGHFFDELIAETVSIDEYKAHYSANYVPFPEKTSVQLLNNFYLNRNTYYSIQRAKPDFLKIYFPDLLGQLGRPAGIKVKNPDQPPYTPSEKDERDYRLGKNYYRPDQGKFRSELLDYYGSKCMLSGFSIAQALEASHICHYRGAEDNHYENGLVLRRDLHSLFDADLLGIEPNTLKVVLAPSVKRSDYSVFEGTALSLNNSACRPSYAALQIRWMLFMEKNYPGVIVL